MTYDPDALAEREAILAADDIPNAGQQAALQMACALWTVDKATTLSPRQRDWLQAKVLAGTVLTPHEIVRLTPGLLAWADAMDGDFGIVLREALGLAERLPVERPRDMAFVAGQVKNTEKE